MSQLSTSYPSGELIRNIMQETVLCGLIWTNWSVSRIFHCTWETQWNTAFSKYLQTSFTSWKFILWCKHVMQPSDTVEDPEVLIMALAIERPGSFLFSFFSYSFPTLSISFVWAQWVMMGHGCPKLLCCDSVTLWLPRASTFGVLLRWSGCHIALDWGPSQVPTPRFRKFTRCFKRCFLDFFWISTGSVRSARFCFRF